MNSSFVSYEGGDNEEIDGTAKIKFFVQTNYGKTYLTKINYCFSFFLK